MKIKGSLEAHPIITSLAQQKVSPRLAYNLQKNLRLIQAEMDTFDKARLDGMVALDCELDETRGSMSSRKTSRPSGSASMASCWKRMSACSRM